MSPKIVLFKKLVFPCFDNESPKIFKVIGIIEKKDINIKT